MTRRLERAADLLRSTDWSVARICHSVGLSGVGSFTTSFGRMFGMTPTAYRAAFPSPADLAPIPACVLRVYGRPQHRTFREDRVETTP
jgi:AraC-like DNA-binding protein